MKDKGLNPRELSSPQKDQSRLPEEASLLTDVLDQVSDGVYITDPERNILYWNRAAEDITGFKKEEVLGKRCADGILEHTDLAGNKLCSTELCPLYKAINSGKAPAAPLTLKALHKAGRRVVVEVSITPLRGASGDPIGGIEIFRDISAKVELEEQKARFFSSLSHELKTPLANMQGYLELLLARDAGDINALQEEFLNTIYSEEQKLGGYIEELLNMGRFEGTDYSYRRTVMDLSALLESLIRSFKQEAEKKGLRLTHDIAPGLGLLGDKERLSQALGNLIGNAIKYTSAGTISIQARFDREKEEISVMISDSGIGIPETDQKAIFEMFYRVEDPGVRDKSGTGVGLYIADRVIRRHDGQISLDSAPGKGSVFTVSLPGFVKENDQ